MMQHIKKRDFAGEVNFEFLIESLFHLKNDTSIFKTDQFKFYIQILQVKKDQVFLFLYHFLNVFIFT